jgi:hypothetical protein
MADHDQAASTIDQLENRLASLHDLGVDTAALRSQLAFARTQLHDGRVAEALGICEEVAATAKRLANGSAPAERPRTGRFTRDQLAETLHDLLAQGMFAKLMAEHRSGPDIRLEARLNEMDEKVRAHVAHEVEALRAEQLVMRNALSVQNVATDDVRTVSERLPDESVPAVLDSEPAWAQALSNTLQAVAERLQSAPVTESGAPAWSQGLQDALEAVADRLQPPVQSSAQSSAQPELTSAVAEPAWSVTLREVLASAEARHQELLAAVVRSPANSSDTALGDQLATALERGLHDLGTLLAERPSHSAMPMTSSSDDVHEALTRVTAKVFDHSTTRAIAHTTTRADRPAIATVSDSDLVKRLVAEEVEAHLGRHGTEVFTNKNIGPDDIRALVMDEMEKARGAKSQRIEANDQRAVLLRLLPTMLSDDSVRQSLFAVLAMEAVSKPGALGELTGLRAFLRRELAHAAEEMGSKLEAV